MIEALELQISDLKNEAQSIKGAIGTTEHYLLPLRNRNVSIEDITKLLEENLSHLTKKEQNFKEQIAARERRILILKNSSNPSDWETDMLERLRVNAYWPTAYGKGDDSEKIPACSSIDGKTGFDPSTGEVTPCESCPYNQYGTGVDENGNSKKGKACKNMRRIYMMMDGDPNFYLLTVPPTSIKDINKQLARILASGIPYTGMVVSFTLEKVKNSGGIAYSKVQVKKSGFLPKATAEAVKALHRELKAQYKNTAVTSEDYTAPANTGLDIDPDDDDLPFN